MMGKMVASVIAGVFMWVLAAPAMADCNADIAKVEPAILKVTNTTKKTAAEKQITEAKDAAKQKKEKECMEYLTAAKKTAGVK